MRERFQERWISLTSFSNFTDLTLGLEFVDKRGNSAIEGKCDFVGILGVCPTHMDPCSVQTSDLAIGRARRVELYQSDHPIRSLSGRSHQMKNRQPTAETALHCPRCEENHSPTSCGAPR